MFNKKSQTEVITTVLLILISILAISLVSVFVLKMVRNNLTQTECFNTIGKLSIYSGTDATFFNNSDKILSLSIAQDFGDFNISGMILSIGDSKNSKAIKIKPGIVSGVTMYDGNANLVLPSQGGRTTYKINATYYGLQEVQVASVSAILNRECDKSDTMSIISK